MTAKFRSLLIALLIPGGLSAQVEPFKPRPRATQAPSPAPAATPNAAPNAADAKPAAPAPAGVNPALSVSSLESNTLLQAIDRAFNVNSDSINPEDGTLVWKGKTYNIGQFRAFRARFERYLSLPVTDDNLVHQAIMNEIESVLSTKAGDDAGSDIKRAWQLLYRSAEYTEDGGASIAVANQVFNAWRTRDEKEAYTVTQNELERIRREQQGAVSFAGDLLVADGVNAAQQVADQLSSGDSGADDSDAASSTSDNQNATGSATVNGATVTGQAGRTRRGRNASRQSSQAQQKKTPSAGTVSQFFRTRGLAETEAKIKASEASALLTANQAKLQFQSQIVNLFLQRRFEHCIIAVNFYRYIFKGSAQNLEVGKKELSEFLPSSDFALTVEMLESLSREAINDVNASMQAINLSYGDGQLVNALERLQETFFIGEFVPSVATFDRGKKQVLLDLYRKIDTARKLADLKDYDALAKLTNDIGKLTKDFRASEVNSAVRSAQRMSTLALSAARQAVVEQNLSTAQEFVEKAAQIWPLNPAIEAYTQGLADQVNVGVQAAKLFDEAISRNDLRLIFDQRSELGIGLINDTARLGKLKSIVDQMSRLEIYLIQSRELLNSGNAYGAWEALVAATPLAPDDVELNRNKATLAPRVANFVAKLDQAARDEQNGAYAASLTQFLAAQAVYPASTIAREGIERVSQRVLDEQAKEAAAPTTPAGTASSAPDSESPTM